MQNSYKALVFNTLELVKLCISRKKESLFSDLEATDSELSETLQTIENRSFKRFSCINRAVSLSNESLKKSLLGEIRQCGGVQLLHEIADGKVRDEALRNGLKEASAAQVNITLLWCALCKEYQLVEELLCLGANVRQVDFLLFLNTQQFFWHFDFPQGTKEKRFTHKNTLFC